MMTNRLDTKTTKSSDESTFSNAQSQTNAFNSRSFVVTQAKTTNDTNKPDLKTSLQQAQKYGHNPNQIQSANISKDKAIQQAKPKKPPKKVYRLDEREPQQISNTGFSPHNPNGNVSLEEHVSGVLNSPDANGGTATKPHSQYVSTGKLGMLKDEKIMSMVPGKNLYRINTKGQGQNNFHSVKEHYKKIGEKEPYPKQKEWAHHGTIPPQAITQYLPQEKLVNQLPLKPNPIMPWRTKKLKGWENMPPSQQHQ